LLLKKNLIRKAGTQEPRNRGNGNSEIEGKAARAGGERAGTRTSFKGIAEIEHARSREWKLLGKPT
jgi:hypothetical protein